MTDRNSSESATSVAGDASGSRTNAALLDCLIIVSNMHGRSITRDAAMAGLPANGYELTPALFERAARRAGFASRVSRVALKGVNVALLPAVLLLEGSEACVLLGWDETGNSARVVFPALPDAVTEMPVTELADRYSERLIYMRPEFQYDARAPQVRPTRGQHWFWGVIGENRSLYRDVLLAAFLINVFALAMPLFVMNVYDRVVPNNAIDTLWVLAVGVLVVIVGDLVLRTMRGHFVDLASSRADVKLSARIMEQVLGLRMENRPKSAGSFASNLRAFEAIRDFIGSATVVALVDLPFALVFLIAIAWIATPLVIPFLVGALILLAYAIAVQSRMHQLAETSHRAGAQRNATLVESLVGIETVKSLGVESVVQRKWEESASLLARVNGQLRLLSASTTNVALWVQHVVSVVVIVVGVHLIGEGLLTMGGLIACYLLSSRAMAPLGQAAAILVQYHNAATALEGLEGMMSQEVERPATAKFLSRSHFNGAIEFRNVSFNYPEATAAALSGVSIKINPGERIGILGRIGSGKSTLQKLILGLYRPSSGSILVDGVDIRQLDPAELRRSVGYVGQDMPLFFGTLRDNITMAMPMASDEDVIEAARNAGILEFANDHPEGFDMLVSERGDSLSGGQRQGVGIARALIQKPSILLLDEPTSSMDHSSEETIKRRLADYAVGRTLIIVTHRTSLLDLVDRIIVVDAGRVVADGPKAQVVEALRQGRIGRAGA